MSFSTGYISCFIKWEEKHRVSLILPKYKTSALNLAAIYMNGMNSCYASLGLTINFLRLLNHEI